MSQTKASTIEKARDGGPGGPSNSNFTIAKENEGSIVLRHMWSCVRSKKRRNCLSPFLLRSLTFFTVKTTLARDLGRTTSFLGDVKSSRGDSSLREHIGPGLGSSGVSAWLRARLRESVSGLRGNNYHVKYIQ